MKLAFLAVTACAILFLVCPVPGARLASYASFVLTTLGLWGLPL